MVRTSYFSYGKGQIWHLSRAVTTLPIKTKFWTIDYVGKIKRSVKFGTIGSRGASLHVGEMCSFTVFSSCFVDQATDHNSQWILMYYGSKDFVWRPIVVGRAHLNPYGGGLTIWWHSISQQWIWRGRTILAIRVSKMTKVTSQALYKKNIEIKEKKKKINESSDDF